MSRAAKSRQICRIVYVFLATDDIERSISSRNRLVDEDHCFSYTASIYLPYVVSASMVTLKGKKL